MTLYRVADEELLAERRDELLVARGQEAAAPGANESPAVAVYAARFPWSAFGVAGLCMGIVLLDSPAH